MSYVLTAEWLRDWLIVYSLCNFRLHHVILGSPVLSGMVRRRYSRWPRDLWHNGAYCRIVFRNFPNVQGGRRHARLDTHRAVVGWWYFEYLLVRIEAFRWGLRSERKLHVYVAKTCFWTNRWTTWRHSTTNKISHTRFVIYVVIIVIVIVSVSVSVPRVWL